MVSYIDLLENKAYIITKNTKKLLLIISTDSLLPIIRVLTLGYSVDMKNQLRTSKKL